MELKDAPKPPVSEAAQQQAASEAPLGLTTFIRYQDETKRSVRFRVNTTVEDFRQRAEASVIAQQAPMPSGMFQLEIVLDALSGLHTKFQSSNFTPEMRRMTFHEPFGISSSTDLYLDVVCRDTGDSNWQWKLHGMGRREGAPVTYTSGALSFRPSSDEDLKEEFESIQRIISQNRCIDLLNDYAADEVLQGRSIYRAFDPIIKWTSPYRKSQRLLPRAWRQQAVSRRQSPLKLLPILFSLSASVKWQVSMSTS